MFQDLFDKYRMNAKRAEQYGFEVDGEVSLYQQLIMDGEFLLAVRFEGNQLDFHVWDQETGDEYVQVGMERMTGEFVGQVREVCQQVLLDIRAACFDSQSYLSEQTQRILDAVARTYGDHVEYLWEKSPDAGAIRHPDSKKWYAVFMTIDYEKLDTKRTGAIEVLNLKQDNVPELLTKTGIYPAFHMNKKYWISLVLDNTLTDRTILDLIDKSWQLTKK